MEAELYNINGEVSGKVTLPSFFSVEFREDLVRRALLSEQSRDFQPQGHSLMAGLNTTAIYVGKYSGYRRGRHMGIAIRPRQKLGGGAMGDVRRIPSSVKGRRAHPHKIEKILVERINKKEYIKAIESAIAGSSKSELITKRHTLSRKVPIVVDDSIENLSKSRELIAVLNKFGLSGDLERSQKPRLRKGLARSSNKRHFRRSVLIVAKNTQKIGKAGRNIPGVDVCSVDSLSIKLLAPGAAPRLAIWSKGAIESVEKALSER